MHDCIAVENQAPAATIANYIAHLTCIASVAMVIVRCTFQTHLSFIDYVPYFAMFCIAKSFDIGSRMLRVTVA
jgi:hypothetical protein